MDDGYADHPKVLALSDAAFRAHVGMMCYAAKHLTDGFVPSRAVAARPRIVAELVAQRLIEASTGGWTLHDYLDWNSPAEQIKAVRRVRVESGRKGGRANG